MFSSLLELLPPGLHLLYTDAKNVKVEIKILGYRDPRCKHEKSRIRVSV